MAAFAIGTSYAIANKSLQRAITARERSQALSIIQNQITDLKARYKYTFFTDQSAFNKYFSAESTLYPATPPYPASAHHFCLSDKPTDKDVLGTWGPIDNSLPSNATPTDYADSSKYNQNCKPPGYDTEFDVDINAEITQTSAAANTKTVYRVSVQWQAVGGVQSSAVVYYRF
jgi:hypothetical protein